MANTAVLASLKAFAAGELRPAEFKERLYNVPEFEPVLTLDPHLDQANYVNGSTYLFLLSCDFEDPAGVLDAHGAVCDFLNRNGHEYRRTDEYDDFFGLVLRASPNWLSADPRYVRDKIMPEAGGRTGAELQAWLTDRLMERYRCVSGPPEWIQSPTWPHGAADPLVFLGQFDVSGYFHDSATVYVFHDPETGGCQTIIQCF